MAVAGDVVIKLAADFAEFSKGMQDSQQQLVKFGEAATGAGEKFGSFITLAKSALAGLSVAAIVNQVEQYADKIQKAAVNTADLARSTNLTTSQVQALQALAEKTGDSFSDLAKKGAANTEWLAQVTADAERAGLVMDSSVVQTLKRIQAESDEASRRMDVFFAPAVAGAKSFIADSLERIANDLATIGMQQGVIDKLIALAQMLGYGGGAGAAGQFRVDSLTDQVARRQAELAQAQVPSQREEGQTTVVVPPDPAVVAQAQKSLDEARTLLGEAKDAAAKAAYGTTTLDAKAITVVADRIKPGGGGGKTDDDLLQAQIDRYNAMAKAATTAFATISKGEGQNIEDLKRQVDVQQKVDEIAGRLGAKYKDASDTQKKALYDAVAGYEQERAAAQKLLEVNTAAVETDKKYGTGQVQLAKLQKDLNDQLKTGRITTDDYTRSIKENSEAIAQGALAAKRYDDNLGSMIAGFQHAAAAFSRSNDLYSLGEQAFNGLTSAMTEGLKALEGQSNKTFGQIAADFANMLAEMALKAAVSQVFNAVFGAIGAGLGGGATANLSGFAAGGGPQGPSGGAVAGGSWFSDLFRAGGGPVNAGQPYVVGERGAELFVPSAAGRIVPAGTGGGGGGDVNVNVDMTKGDATSDPKQGLEFGRKVKQAVVGVIENEKRPGGTLYQRLSA